MTKAEVKNLKVGSKIENILGDIQVVVSIKDGILYEMKWIKENGELSKGSEIKVPSHFEYDTLVSI